MGAASEVCAPVTTLQEKPTASCPALAGDNLQFSLLNSRARHVSAGARQKAEAEASGLFNAFSVTHCSPFLEIRPMPQSVLTAEVKPRASAVTSLHLLSAGRTNPPQSPTNCPPEGFTLILADSTVARFAHVPQDAEHPKNQLLSRREESPQCQHRAPALPCPLVSPPSAGH